MNLCNKYRFRNCIVDKIRTFFSRRRKKDIANCISFNLILYCKFTWTFILYTEIGWLKNQGLFSRRKKPPIIILLNLMSYCDFTWTFFILNLFLKFLTTSKGQIFSKELFLVFSNSPKKRTNKFVFTSTMNSFVCFLREELDPT